MNNLEKERPEQQEKILPSTTYFEVPAETFLIKEDGAPPKLPPRCTIQVQIGAPQLFANNTKVRITVFYNTMPGTPGILSVYFKILSKFFIFKHIIPSNPPLRHPLILAESQDMNWQTSTYKRRFLNPAGQEVEEIKNAEDMRPQLNCPPRVRETFVYPVETVMDKYLKFKAWAKCCGQNPKIITPTESDEGFYFRSNP